MEKMIMNDPQDASVVCVLADVQGVLAVQAKTLDFKYLRTFAKELGLDDLLERAISESQM